MDLIRVRIDIKDLKFYKRSIDLSDYNIEHMRDLRFYIYDDLPIKVKFWYNAEDSSLHIHGTSEFTFNVYESMSDCKYIEIDYYSVADQRDIRIEKLLDK